MLLKALASCLTLQKLENEKEMAIRIAIVEDDEEIRTYLTETVSGREDFSFEGAFPDAESLLKAFNDVNPQVVIMDIHLPGQSGIECVRQLKEKSPDSQFLMCTIFEDTENIFNSLCAGATGYLLKNSSPEQLASAIKEIYAGGSPMSAPIARKVVTAFSHQRNQKNLVSNKLSTREKEILDFLSKGLRYKEIADKLFISTETVRTHIRNIYEKLQVNSRAEAMNKMYPH